MVSALFTALAMIAAGQADPGRIEPVQPKAPATAERPADSMRAHRPRRRN